MKIWVLGARPRTLSAAVVPVLVGTAAASAEGDVRWWRAGLALVVALALQVGVNYANDYSDGIRGADAERVGPVRLVASGLAAPARVRTAAFMAFGVAGAAGLALSLAVDPRLLVVGALCIAAAWFYTGGSRPYGYSGLGELAVFAFFGLVATAGSAYVQLRRLTPLALGAAVPVGLLAAALLVANNLRDIPGDERAGKRTLAVRLGDPATRLVYAGCIVGAALVVTALAIATRRPGALVGLLALPLAARPLAVVRAGARGPALVPVLAGTSRLHLAFGALFALGLALS